MPFTAGLKIISERNIEGRHTLDETNTKLNFINPLIELLGYNFHVDVSAEYPSSQNGGATRVDYALFRNIKPKSDQQEDFITPDIIVECKRTNSNLDTKDIKQLFQYFNALPSVKIGLLTNGIVYKFFSDLDNDCNGQLKQDTLLSRFLIEFPFIFERGLIAYF